MATLATFSNYPNLESGLGAALSQSYSKKPQELLRSLGVNPDKGLTDQEAAMRLNQYGKNSLVEEKERRLLGIPREEITEPMILLLIVVGVLYSILGRLN